MSSVYFYSPLKTQREIRLLYLCPGSDEEPLRCIIRHVDLDAAPSYSAISYVWGSPTVSAALIVADDYALAITQSLFLALKDIRAFCCKNQQQALWADGVCIQQSDAKERAQQVSIMKVIYRQAGRVLTYTGPETESSTQSLDFIDELGEKMRVCKNDRTELRIPPPHDQRWTALREFFQRPWPSRLWIVQEFLLSQSSPILLCGRREVSWSLVLDLALLAHDGHLPFVIRHSGTDSASSLLWLGELRKAAHNPEARKDITMVELLRACRARHCTDAKDKIYAVLSVASDAERLQVRTDYTLSKRELYTEVAAKIIQTTQSLEILKSAGHEEESDLPSWVPDWDTDRVTVPLDMNDFLFESSSTYMFSAGGHDESSTKIEASAESGILSFRCKFIDRIALLTDVVCAKRKTRDHSLMAWLQETMKLFDTTVYGEEEDMEKAFWQTLQGGRNHDRQNATVDFEPQYSAWKEHISTGKGSTPSKSTEQFLRSIRRGCHLRRLCRSSSGYIGLVPSHSREGDEICVVRGARVPFVIRESGEFQCFIGECYVHGFMEGQALTCLSLSFK